MSYTTPTTRSTGDLITASIYNVDIVENIKVMDAVGFDYIIDGGGGAITTGVKAPIRVEYNMSVTDVSLSADQAGSIDIDPLYRATWDSDVLTTSDSNTTASSSDGGTTDKMLQIVTNTISSDTFPAALWTTTSLAQGGSIGFRVHAITTLTRVTVSVRGSKL